MTDETVELDIKEIDRLEELLVPEIGKFVDEFGADYVAFALASLAGSAAKVAFVPGEGEGTPPNFMALMVCSKLFMSAMRGNEGKSEAEGEPSGVFVISIGPNGQCDCPECRAARGDADSDTIH